jgi:uncharacterized protein YjiS (DUF1127 family)
MDPTLGDAWLEPNKYRSQAALAIAWRRGWALVACWRDRARQRQLLAALDDRALADIAVTRLEAARECAKPFWRA